MFRILKLNFTFFLKIFSQNFFLPYFSDDFQAKLNFCFCFSNGVRLQKS